MTTYAEFQADLTRICDRLRRAGLPDDKVDAFAKRWLREASLAELDETVGKLDLIEKRISSDKEQSAEVFGEVMQLFECIGEIAGRPEVVAILASGEPAPMVPPKYPNIRVNPADLNGQVGLILRRVSYAMSDGGVDDAEIEQFKSEIKNSSNPVGVSKKWVRVE